MPLILEDPALFKESCFINGEWMNSPSKEEVTDPFDHSYLGSCPKMDEKTVHYAIESAQKAYLLWRQKPSKERSELLKNWYRLILENQKDLAMIMTREQGKPIEESMGEISYAASFIQWYAEEAKRTYGDIIPSPSPQHRILVSKAPVGVCSAITPWNFPAAMITRKVAPALAAGCTMVLKPSVLTPFSAFALAELSHRAGIPKGVFNVLTGDAGTIGNILSTHETVKKLSFTGSTSIGKILMERAAATVKKVSLELGGNAPFIVFDDADIDAAIKGAITSKFRNTGQTCVCANRFFIHQRILSEFIEKLNKQVKRLRVASGITPKTQIGPLIHMDAVLKIEALLKDAIDKGGRIDLGGNRHALGGTFFEPTIIENISSDMKIFHEEIFGPVAPIISFSEEEEVLELANRTPYGLAAYFYTRDLKRAFHISEMLDYGIIGVNTGMISTEVAPFGGMKASGIGREGSKYGIDEYLELKYISLGGM